MTFIFVTDKTGVSYSLNKNMILRVADTRDGPMIVMREGFTLFTKENFLELCARLNAN